MVEILNTKLFIPRSRKNQVSRPRLVNRLNAGQDKKLTLIAAPAGFGKTTLLSEWIPSSPRCVTWLSLDEGDNSPARFWMYFIAALQTISPEIGRDAQALLPSFQPHDIESILNILINEINAFGDAFVHVFDDYHLIDSTEIDHELAYLIDHQPSNLHLVIATRENPDLPLARLRARDQLTELRASDLRFTLSEATEFLHAMSLNLSAEDVHALEDRTEGWIAGLQLAALSMQGRRDVSGFIRAFAGDHQYIVDYLVEEVLQRQPESVRNFLLQTSILDRLNGALCDAVTGQSGGKERLETLQRGNFFVIPLDDKRHWYRYHHLFAEVLFVHLKAEQPDQVPALHRRASEWYEQHGSTPDAIRHVLAARDYPRAADLVELNLRALLRSRQEATVLNWLKALPKELIRDRPVLCNGYAGALLASGKMDDVDNWLAAAEQWLDPTTSMRKQPESMAAKMIVIDEAEFRRLPGAIAVHRAGQALMLGNLADTLKFARQALDLAPDDDYLGRGGAAALQGLVYWTCGDLEAGYRMYAEGMAWLQRAGNISDVLGCSLALADIRTAQGCLHETMRTYEQGLQLAADQGTPEMRGTADMHVGMSELYREQNDLQAAMHHLRKSQEQGEHTGLPQNRYRWCAAMARIQEAEGNLNEALDLLHEAERLYASDFFPNVRPIGAMKARIWAAQGRLGEAITWVREQGLSTEDSLSYLHEFEHITLARILLARYKSDHTDSSICEAIGLLDRLLKTADEGRRSGRTIEILILQALAHQAQSDIPAALQPLEHALTLAEPEGYLRMFLDEGADMMQLLREAAARRIMPEYIGKLLAAFADEQHRDVVASPSPTPKFLIEPLSQRELEVLRLFKTELSGPEIARELVVALSTVRTHTKSIYTKLNVNNRRAAVKRAIELGLI